MSSEISVKDCSTPPEPAFIENERPFFNSRYYDHSGVPVNIPFGRRDFYKIWLLNSESNLHYANRTIHIKQPALVFSNPLIPYAYEGLSENRSGYWCIFKEEFLKTNDRVKSLQESPLFRVGSDNVFLLDPEQEASVKGLFDKIISEMATSYLHKYEVIKNYVNLLIHEAMKMQATTDYQHQNAAARIANLFFELLEWQFPIESPELRLKLRKAGDYANNMSVHVNHLNHSVKEITGKPTSVHIAERMLNEAKTLLKHTDWSITDIAYGLGFEYPNHFNNFFKKHTEVTPLAFRNQTKIV